MNKNTKIEQEIAMKAVQLYESGLNTKQVAQELGIGHTSAYRILQANGATIRFTKKLITQDTIDEIRQLVADGVGFRKIAKKFEIGHPTLRRIMAENGIESKYEWGAVGEKHGSFKTGKQINPQGYVLVWVDPSDPMHIMAKTDNYVLEHRLVMAREIGRPLKSYETVHHINGDRTDNRLKNLQLRVGQHGNGQVYCCADCGSRNIVQCEID